MMRLSDVSPILGDPTAYTGALVRSKSLIVCTGPRGAGKTTTAVALGAAGAAMGRKVLVLTSRPSRPLAETLGLPETSPSLEASPSSPPGAPGPHPVGRVVRDTLAPEASGELFVEVLAPAAVFEASVRALLGGGAVVDAVFAHPLYRSFADVLPWFEESAMAEAAHARVTSGDYDLVIVDVPPSRSPLSFLYAPRDVAKFFDEGAIGLFSPRRGTLARASLELFESAFSHAFGEGRANETESWIGLFADAVDTFHEHAEAVRTRLTASSTAFVLVTTSDAVSLKQASAVVAEMRELGLPFAGYVLNRSWAYTRGFTEPSTSLPEPEGDMRRVVLRRKLLQLADIERYRAQRDRNTLARLSMEAESGAAVAVPQVGDAAATPEGLALIARNLVHIDLP